MGPNIPLKAGHFRVRWIGTTEVAAGQELGFVDVWSDGRLLQRGRAVSGAFPLDTKVLAEVAFTLTEPTGNLGVPALCEPRRPDGARAGQPRNHTCSVGRLLALSIAPHADHILFHARLTRRHCSHAFSPYFEIASPHRPGGSRCFSSAACCK